MPHPDVIPQYLTVPRHASIEFVNAWLAFFRVLRERHGPGDYKLGLFTDFPFLGASYLDWNRPGGFIHVSPYIWGRQANKCPGYELEWVGRSPSSVFDAYVSGLMTLNGQTKNEIQR